MLYEEFYKELKESKDGLYQKRKFIRTQCKICQKIIEYDFRKKISHGGKCRSCNNKTRIGHVLTDKDVIYERCGRREKGVKFICPLCKLEHILPSIDANKRTGYCKKCFSKGNVKRKSIDEIRDYIKKNTKVDEKGCWIWQKGKDKDGYGISTMNSINWKTHRLSYSIYKSPITENLFICHLCNVSSCCNPEHLYLGDSKTNVKDMLKANRQAKGEKNGSSKLKENDVLEIKKSDKEVRSIELAKKYNVHLTCINRIRSGKSWKHIIA